MAPQGGRRYPPSASSMPTIWHDSCKARIIPGFQYFLAWFLQFVSWHGYCSITFGMHLGCITVGMHLGCVAFGMHLGCAYSWHDMCKGPVPIPGMILARASRSIGQGICAPITLRLGTLGHFLSGYRWANIPIYPFWGVLWVVQTESYWGTRSKALRRKCSAVHRIAETGSCTGVQCVE
jgi:hypothetical protein